MMFAYKFFYVWLLPPAIFLLLLIFLAWRLGKKFPQPAIFVWLTVFLLYFSSVWPVAELLLRPLEYKYVLPQTMKADAIVLLGGGIMADVPLPPGWTGQVGDAPTQRLLAAYALHRRNGWPILISGGEVWAGYGAEAAVMRDILVDLGMPPDKVFLENKSVNTRQNAEMTAELLRRHGWKRPVLVTSAFHMLRSVEEFRRAGVAVTPYPVGYYASRQHHWTMLSVVPSASALQGTAIALKEYMGLAALQLR